MPTTLTTQGQAWLYKLEQQQLPFLSRGLLCRSPQGRKVDILVIKEQARAAGCQHAGQNGMCQQRKVGSASAGAAVAAAGGGGGARGKGAAVAAAGGIGEAREKGAAVAAAGGGGSEARGRRAVAAAGDDSIEPDATGVTESEADVALAGEIAGEGKGGQGSGDDSALASEASLGNREEESSLEGCGSSKQYLPSELCSRAGSSNVPSSVAEAGQCNDDRNSNNSINNSSKFIISSSTSSESPRPVVVLTARVHPGEVPASHLLNGLVKFLCSKDPFAVVLRSHITWVVIPMLNPDGVAVGNYRTDAAGADLNRMWLTASKLCEPSVYAALGVLQHYYGDAGEGVGGFGGSQVQEEQCEGQQQLTNQQQELQQESQQQQLQEQQLQQQQPQQQQQQEQVRVFIDVHAHSTSRSSFLFCNPPEDAIVVVEGGRRELGTGEAACTCREPLKREDASSLWRKKAPISCYAQDNVHALPK